MRFPQTYETVGETVARWVNCRLSEVLEWVTPAERYDGTPFVDRGFAHIPALAHLQPWLEGLMRAA
jgi:hypothetical protein